mgnify:CR=1 FL=1
MIKTIFLTAVLLSLAGCVQHQDLGSCGDDADCALLLDACDGLDDGDSCTVNGIAGTCDSGSCVLPGPTCTPSAELCNQIDDDCNGIVDDGVDCAVCANQPDGTSCTYGSNGAVHTGVCQDGSCVEELDLPCTTPSDEICNGVDDDCDGIVDDGVDCGVCANQPDGTSCTYEANGVEHTGTCQAGACVESCSEGDACSYEVGGVVHVGTCEAGACVESCTSSPEVCNGMDDDCNGLVDDGVNCSACAGHPDGDACTITVNGVSTVGACAGGVCVP